MNFEFLNEIPSEFEKKALLISGDRSSTFARWDYLVMKENDVIQNAFQIRYEYHCSPFRQAMLLKSILAVGYEGYFYLYDLSTKSNLLSLEMDGYFGHLYINDNLFYVTSASNIYCINEGGHLLWENSNAGIDGVLIEKFEENRIYGTGDLDPPGGWKDFIIDLRSGKFIP